MKADALSGASQIAASEWRRLATGGNPFLRHEFLAGLEATGCVGAGTGWQPAFVTLQDAAGLAAAAPVYLKQHSYGEFVFDFSWAQAYARAGQLYYPKLIVAVPFTPATGPRLLVREGLDVPTWQARLRAAIEARAEALGVSSVHALFPPAAEQEALRAAGWLGRQDCQFHWRNAGYGSFEDFLATFSHDKRKKARRERRRVAESGITFETRTGLDVDEHELVRAFELHRETFHRHGHEPYLNLGFFRHAARALGEGFVLKLARRESQIVAVAVFFQGGGTLYGRYWGAGEDFHSLHFETCYHQGVEFCIERGLERFEPGTQGEHKVSRGFEPTITHSAHHVLDPRFRAAIAEYLRRETRAVGEYASAVQQHVPYRDRKDDAPGVA